MFPLPAANGSTPEISLVEDHPELYFKKTKTNKPKKKSFSDSLNYKANN